MGEVSRIQVPADIEDPKVLRRLLTQMTDKLAQQDARQQQARQTVEEQLGILRNEFNVRDEKLKQLKELYFDLDSRPLPWYKNWAVMWNTSDGRYNHSTTTSHTLIDMPTSGDGGVNSVGGQTSAIRQDGAGQFENIGDKPIRVFMSWSFDCRRNSGTATRTYDFQNWYNGAVSWQDKFIVLTDANQDFTFNRHMTLKPGDKAGLSVAQVSDGSNISINAYRGQCYETYDPRAAE